jgi:ribosomal protein L37E
VETHRTPGGYSLPPKGPQVGGEIDVPCRRCGEVTTHTILALVGGEPARVMCQRCKSQHAFHREAGAQKKPARPRAEKTSLTGRPAGGTFAEVSRGKDLSRAIPYDPHRTFAAGEVVRHPVFGVGVVSALREGGKMLVVFPDQIRMLIHGR